MVSGIMWRQKKTTFVILDRNQVDVRISKWHCSVGHSVAGALEVCFHFCIARRMRNGWKYLGESWVKRRVLTANALAINVILIDYARELLVSSGGRDTASVEVVQYWQDSRMAFRKQYSCWWTLKHWYGSWVVRDFRASWVRPRESRIVSHASWVTHRDSCIVI